VEVPAGAEEVPADVVDWPEPEVVAVVVVTGGMLPEMTCAEVEEDPELVLELTVAPMEKEPEVV